MAEDQNSLRNLLDKIGLVAFIADGSILPRAIGEAISYAKQKYIDGKRTLSEILALLQQDIAKSGLDILGYRPVGDHALPRKYELAAAINRLRTLEML